MEDEKMPVKGFADPEGNQFGLREAFQHIHGALTEAIAQKDKELFEDMKNKQQEDFELKNGRLLIGGPCDGQRRVPRDIRRFDRLVIPIAKVVSAADFMSYPGPIAGELKHAIYEPEILRGKEIEILFYRHSSLTTDDALRLLLERYPKR